MQVWRDEQPAQFAESAPPPMALVWRQIRRKTKQDKLLFSNDTRFNSHYLKLTMYLIIQSVFYEISGLPVIFCQYRYHDS